MKTGNPSDWLRNTDMYPCPTGCTTTTCRIIRGNNRVVADRNGKVEEVNHYYPFGGTFANNGNVQPYKYNGKELDTRKGLNWYDYGARHYDPTIGRWHVQDPMAENLNPWSPYIYCLNNPIAYVDKNGEIPFLTNLIGAAVGAGVEYIGQVATNILTDQKIQFSDFTNIDIADIGIAAGEGFITSGGSAVRNAFAKVAVSIGTEVLQNAVDINHHLKKESV